MKKFLVTFAKISISALILGYLFWDATRTKNGSNVFVTMLEQPKRWDLLLAAWVASAAAVVLTLVRWCYLVRAVGIPLPMRDALRIGFLGCLFNLAPMGIVGGDLLKAFLLAREYPGNRAKALASVVIDRVIGLYVLFLVAAAGILLTGYWRLPIPEIQLICRAALLVTVVSTVGIGVLFVPGVMGDWLIRILARVPRVGTALVSLIEAIRLYRRNVPVLLLSSLLTVGVHCVFVLSIYLVACGLPGDVLSLGTHFVLYPISGVASTLPLPAGPFEAVLEFMYSHVRVANVVIPKGQGLVVALVFRLIGILVATFGFCYYLQGRREVSEVMHEAEGDSDDSASTVTPEATTI